LKPDVPGRARYASRTVADESEYQCARPAHQPTGHDAQTKIRLNVSIDAENFYCRTGTLMGGIFLLPKLNVKLTFRDAIGRQGGRDPIEGELPAC
jgi:hypothetical protein